ncbi:MAG: hypothetical protein ACYTEG_00340 [Planctomycetota bacterium]
MKHLVLLLLAGSAFAQAETVEELKKQVAHLKELNSRLAAQLEGTAAPINLARTSLAAVNASSVNGDRPLDNKFHGALNLFDNGANKHNGIQYTRWTTGGEARPWVEIRFDVPVTIAAIEVVGGSAFSGRFRLDRGGEQSTGLAEHRNALKTPLAGVRTVRVTFEPEGTGPQTVDELRILGFVPAGAEYRTEPPRVQLTKAHAEAVARARFQEWTSELLGKTRNEIKRRADGSWEIRILRGELELLRIVVAKNGKVSVEPRAKLVAS